MPWNPLTTWASKMAKETTLPAASTAVSIDEAILVEQTRSGDMNAFSRLVTRYQDRVLNACWRICGNLEDAQDLTQEAFLRALEAIGSFSHKAGFYTWLFRIAVNLSISHRRRKARTATLSLHGPDGRCISEHQTARLVGGGSAEPDDPPARLSARETGRLVREGLEQLDDDHRAVIVLRDLESFNYQQIAQILDLPVGTVKSRLHRARMELRERLKPMVTLE